MGLYEQLQIITNRQKNNSDHPKEQTFVFNTLPQTLGELKKRDEASLSTPFMTSALCIAALARFSTDSEEAVKMLNYLKGPKSLGEFEIQFLKERFMDQEYIPFSYFAGATPQNHYTPNIPYSVTIFEDAYSYVNKDFAKLYIRSGGADNPRYVSLHRIEDKWYLWEQFVMVSIRSPHDSNDEY